MDDYAYAFFASASMKKMLSSIPPLGIMSKSQFGKETDVPAGTLYKLDDGLWEMLGGFGLVLALVALAITVFQGWCGEDTAQHRLVIGVGFGVPASCILASCFVCRLKPLSSM